MDFIERYLGISPDDGDHSLEVMLLVVTFTLIGALALYLSATRGVRKKTRNRFFRGL
jgi:hypothetical protein